MKRTDFTLFFSLPLSDADWRNLQASKVQRVMLPLSLAHARPDILSRLNTMGIRLIARLEETYYEPNAPARVLIQVTEVMQHVAVDALILGVEPDNAFDMTYASYTWGQNHAYRHRDALWAVFNVLRAAHLDIDLISPGHTMHSISEDEVPAPGREAWAEICRPLYSQLDGAGMHLYGYGSDGHYINTVRALFALKMAQERFHKPIWIDEIAFDSGTQLERMDAVIRFARLMENHLLGERVRMLCPFVSNGDGKAYPARLIITDPAAYQLVGRYMQGA